MPLFSNAQNFVLSNSPLTDITVSNSAGPTGIDILFEASTPGAAHDSPTRDPPPRCFPGTRGQYVEDIVNWALPPVSDTPPPIYWMKGPAGVGKSAVAQTCVERLKRLRNLGAAFFFSINGRSNSNSISTNSRGEHYQFFTSIAYQLANNYPEYHNLLDVKIRRNKSLVDKTMESQFWGLIVEPLQELEERGLGIGTRIPVFVDGLDECESREAQREIIEIVAAAARDGVAPLCWAFFSRPEPHIEATFSKLAISPLCRKIALPISRDADGDVELYLRAGFEDIIQRLNIFMDSPWPSNSDMKKLVCAAGGLFIYAKTVLRFVGQPDSLNPEELLRAIIAVISSRDQRGIVAEPAFAELDAFYMLIMQRIPARMFPIIHRVLAVLCWKDYSSAIMIANLLGLSRTELEATCSQLSAVIHFQRQHESLDLDPAINTSQSFLHTSPRLMGGVYHMLSLSLGGSISFYHKSFHDFLLDPLRSGIYCVNINTMEVFFNNRECDLVRQFEEHHCWQGLELVRAPGVPNSTLTLSYPYTNELVNSFIKALNYVSINGEYTRFGADFDFRKRLYVSIILSRAATASKDTLRDTSSQYAGFTKHVHKAIVCWLQPGELLKFDVAKFKEHIEKRQQENIIRPHHTTPPLPDKPQGRVESGLYVIGHGSKSIFWHWEINYDLGVYRHFRTIDLAKGKRVYREERFDLEPGDLGDSDEDMSETDSDESMAETNDARGTDSMAGQDE